MMAYYCNIMMGLITVCQHDFTMKATTAELGLPASFILCKVEDELQQLYLQVFSKNQMTTDF